MKEVLRTNDPVKFSFAESQLSDADIETFVLDEGMSTMYGGVPMFSKRLMVSDADETTARRILAEVLQDET